MKIWMITREYAGVAEAGGVKNVSCSLSESLAKLSHEVTVFIPTYGCTDFSCVQSYSSSWRQPVKVRVASGDELVSFSRGEVGGVVLIFVNHPAFLEKQGVYTYTDSEQLANPAHKKGEGHADRDFLNTLFQKAVVSYAESCSLDECPDIVHCQDAACAMVSTFSRSSKKSRAFFSKTHFVVTIHNAGPGYHHEFKDIACGKWYTGLADRVLRVGVNGEAVEPFLLAAKTATLTTVSPQYAHEITTGLTDTAGLSAAFKRLKVQITGITNGIDFEKYDPAIPAKSLLPFAFCPQKGDLEGKYSCRDYFLTHFATQKTSGTQLFPGVIQSGYIDVSSSSGEEFVYLAYHGRVTHQKGVDVMLSAASRLIQKDLPVRFIFSGQGEVSLEDELSRFALRHAGKCVYMKGYDRSLSRLCIAAADFSLHPSHFEPCCLEDFIAQTFGTLPIAHATGGLCKIVDDETGWLYFPNTAAALAEEVESLVKIMSRAGRAIFRSMIVFASRYVRQTYSWDKVTLQYQSLYESLAASTRPPLADVWMQRL